MDHEVKYFSANLLTFVKWKEKILKKFETQVPKINGFICYLNQCR